MIRRRKLERCPRCGYDRRGLGDRTCPECGAPPPRAVSRGASLDHHDRPTILAAIRGQAVVGVLQLVSGLVVLALVMGPGRYGIVLGVGAAAVSILALVRTASSMRPPEWPRGALETGVRVVGVAMAALAAVAAPVLVLAGAGGLWVTLGVGLPTWFVAVAAGIASVSLAEWTRDDRALGWQDVAWSFVGLAVVLVALLGLAAGFLAVVGAGSSVVSVAGLGGFALAAIRIGAVCWWIIQTVADGKLLVSTVLCLWHRGEHDAADVRRFEREEAWNRELSARFEDDAPGS